MERRDFRKAALDSGFFSSYQFRTYLARLQGEGWVSVSKKEEVFLSGKKHLAKMAGVPENQTTTFFDIPAVALELRQSWLNFTAAVRLEVSARCAKKGGARNVKRLMVASYASKLEHTAKDRIKAQCDVPVPVAHSYHAAVQHSSRSKAIRDRYRAIGAGYAKRTPQFVPIKVSPVELNAGEMCGANNLRPTVGSLSYEETKALRAELAEAAPPGICVASIIRFRDGTVVHRLPDLVQTNLAVRRGHLRREYRKNVKPGTTRAFSDRYEAAKGK